MKTYGLHIGGAEVDAASGETFDALNPTTGTSWATHALAGAADLDRAVRAARDAFESEACRRRASGRSSPTRSPTRS